MVIICPTRPGLENYPQCQSSHSRSHGRELSWTNGYKWYKDNYATPKTGLHFYKPQVVLWDRMQGGPLKICMKATDLAVDNGTLQLDMSKLKPWWRHIIVYDEFYTYSWAHFSVKDVLATATANAMRKSLFHFFKQPQQGGKQCQAVKLKYNQPLILLELPR